MLGFPHQNIFQKIYDIDILTQLFFIELFQNRFFVTNHSRIELCKIRVIELKIPSQQLIEQTPQTPNVTIPAGAPFFPSIIAIALFFSIPVQQQHFRGSDTLSASIFEIKFLVFIQKYATLPKISQGRGDLWQPIHMTNRIRHIQQNIIALQIIMRNIIGMQSLNRLQNRHKYLQKQHLIPFNRPVLFQPPGPKTTLILFHHDIIFIFPNPKIVYTHNTTIQSEILHTRYLRKDIMQHTTVKNRLRETHHLYSNVFGVCKVSIAAKDGPVRARGKLFPVFVYRKVVEVTA
jgi:hypothetical protein